MKSKKAFTLIELLVVIAIIALLLSIVLPALRSVKEQAKKTVCLSHMKQVGTLVLVYAQEHDDQLISVVSSSFSNNDSGAEYYTYYHQFHPTAIQGPSGLGWLYKNDLLESSSDIPFCPSMQNLFGEPQPTQNWNPNGTRSHWNYCGSEPDSTTLLNAKDNDIEWLPLRLSIGIRGLRQHSGGNSRFKTVAQAGMKGQRAFLSDLWAAYHPTYWQTRDADIPHRTGNRSSMNVWELDGHAGNVRMQEGWFERIDNVDYLKSTMTWSIMFD